jgi:hypothetical protein
LPTRRACAQTRPADQKQAARSARKKRRAARKTGVPSLTAFSYLPAVFMTLFFLAASLLLGYIQ